MSWKDAAEALKKNEEIKITFVGRKTKKKISTPVWYVFENNSILLLPVSGSKTNWFKNVAINPQIEVEVDNMKILGECKILKNKKEVDYVIAKFKEKYGEEEIKKWYSGFDAAVRVSPTLPK
ncbi:MAG: nitroreductase/quinone reductase family protein [Thermoproteota archaeon]|nr:nitroreductase family deazaflavin-dependent oxidoreductase [Candidatus Brockarchaeota archaeon]MBO3763459.1 nitroreductase family deazaflavin-dependent oxidoreductase [Candidatus Brockarchaeota archaeon]MBO3800848.1 nitroreductase family deazaflavin-dependent oxidoreductase [Candidatus Brockarchaeota archaeon]